MQEKLIKFATRIPVFMYLTDYREETLKDVITQLEPGLFRKVTGLTVKDFELLVSLGVFNDALMNDAVYKFRRYENASLTYAGIDRHEGERMGLFDTSLSHFDQLAMAQQESMIAPNGLVRGANVSRPVPKPVPRPAKPAKTRVVPSTADVSKAESGGHLSSVGQHVVPEGGKTAKEILAEKRAARAARRAAEAAAPAPVEEPKPAREEITQEQIDALEVGDTIFHKAFGYGSILEIRETLIKVHFFSDDRKKDRMFGFPNAFHQGLLQL